MLIMAARAYRAQVARGLLEGWQAVVRLVELCAELCGTYARDAKQPRHGPCHFNTESVAHADEMVEALGLFGRGASVALARKAASMAFDGSASPMETLHRMMESLSSEYGSLGLPRPAMNEAIDLDESKRFLLSCKQIRPDLSWKDIRVAVEHDGVEWHSSGGRLPLDARRIQDYQTLGWAVLPATYEDVRSQHAFNSFARRLASLMADRGVVASARVDELLCDDGFLRQQARLLAMLLPPREGMASSEDGER